MSKYVSRSRDAGMTLPELLIGVVLVGVLMAAMASTLVVVLRQQDNSIGRVNNARSELNVGLWMPADLASSEKVDTAAGAVPCGTACPAGINLGGSNALMLKWTSQAGQPNGSRIYTFTNVSYRYVQVGNDWQIIRVECSASAPPVGPAAVAPAEPTAGPWTCQQSVVLHNLDAPPPDVLGGWQPGVTVPYWVMVVSEPLDPGCAVNCAVATVDPGFKAKNGKRVIVTINGGGDAAGAGGGTNQISLSAGGTERQVALDPTSEIGPASFVAARTRCGGNWGVIMDSSGSITDMAAVISGVQGVVDAFAGTPVKLQIIDFDSKATVLGAGTAWNKYFDMLNPNDVTSLRNAVATAIDGGFTNWEDAFFRMLKNSDGTVQTVLPDKILFFTDGLPTYSRLDATDATAALNPPGQLVDLPSQSSGYDQESWYRANELVRQYRDVRDPDKLIGVFVGNKTHQSDWLSGSDGYHYENWLRGYHEISTFQVANTIQYEQGARAEVSSKVVFERAQTGVLYQQKIGSTWTTVGSIATYLAGNTAPGEADGWRTLVTGTPGSFISVTQAQYELSNINSATIGTPGDADGWRSKVNSGGASWSIISQSLYDSTNTTTDSSDGFRLTAATPYTAWPPISQTTYDAGNTVAGESDGYRTTLSGTPTSWSSASSTRYNKSNTTADSSDGWRPARSYSSPFSAWEPTTSTTFESNNSTPDSTDGWNGTKVYATPFNHRDWVKTLTKDTTILSRLVAGNDFGVEPLPVGGPYTNVDVANMYVLNDYSTFGNILKGVALAECGGTLTLQTKIGTSSVADPFKYQQTGQWNSAGAVEKHAGEFVTTNGTYKSGTFDFSTGGSFVDVEISPFEPSSLYAPNGTNPWSCTAGGNPITPTVTSIPSSQWKTLKVRVYANQAVSCVQSVKLK
jgi:prepilin-type N-terminal cleavage/methylation domain-containing protein